MGIYHRGAVIHRRRERGWWNWPGWRITVPFAFALALMLSWSPAMSFKKESKEYHCTPNTQYACAGGRCEKVDDGFQHAESFIYNTKTGVLSACLWTNCYAAKVAVFEDTALGAPGTLTAVGKLEPAAHPGNAPVIVSLTIRSGNDSDSSGITNKKAVGFTAVWGYGNKGLTLDMGECALQGLP